MDSNTQQKSRRNVIFIYSIKILTIDFIFIDFDWINGRRVKKGKFFVVGCTMLSILNLSAAVALIFMEHNHRDVHERDQNGLPLDDFLLIRILT